MSPLLSSPQSNTLTCCSLQSDLTLFPCSLSPCVTRRTSELCDLLWHNTHAEENFRIKIVSAQSVVSGKLFGLGVSAGIFLGDTLVCKEEKTRYVPPKDRPIWNQVLEFDEMILKNLPRNARLCLSLHGVWANPLRVKKNKKNFRNEYPLAWVNISVMDFLGQLRQGAIQLQVRMCWTGGSCCCVASVANGMLV